MTLQGRRAFLATLGGGVLAVAGGSRRTAFALSQLPTRRLQKRGIQMYTVRERAMADLSGTLASLASIGFKEIEFWGSFKQTPAQIRQLLDANGMASPSVHIGWPAKVDDFAKVFDAAQVVGQKWITLADPYTSTSLDDWKRLAARMNDAGTRANRAGLRFAVHTYAEMFAKIGDTVPFEVVL